MIGVHIIDGFDDIAIADDFSITESAMKPSSAAFYCNGQSKSRLYKAGLQRYKTRTYKTLDIQSW